MSLMETRKLEMIGIIAVLIISIIIGSSLETLNGISSAFAQPPQKVFSAKLSGKNEVPSINTTAVGGGMLNLTSDGSRITYRIQAMDPNGPFNVTMAAIHKGATGTDGPVVAILTIIPCTIDFCGAPMYLGQGTLT